MRVERTSQRVPALEARIWDVLACCSAYSRTSTSFNRHRSPSHASRAERIDSPADREEPTQLNCRITTCPRESGPAVSVRFVYSARGAPLMQSRQCLISEGVVIELNGLQRACSVSILFFPLRFACSLSRGGSASFLGY